MEVLGISPGHQPGRRHHRRAAQPRGGARGRQGRGLPDGRAARRHRAAGLTGVRVLVTGAAGSIGSVVCSGLVDRGHTVVGLDLVPGAGGLPGRAGSPPTARTPTPWRRSSSPRPGPAGSTPSCTWPASPGEASLPDELTSHVVTTGRPARRDGAPRRDPDRLRQQQPRRRPHPARPSCSTVDVRPRPDTFYGVAKVAAEALLSLYVDRYGIDAVVHPDRELPAAAGDRARPVDLAVARRRRPDGRCGAHRTGPRLRGALRRLREHPRLVGPRGPAARSATTRRTTPRSSPARSRPTPRRTRTRRRTSAARSPPTRSTGQPSTRPSHHPAVVEHQHGTSDPGRGLQHPAGRGHLLRELHGGTPRPRR